MFRLRTLGATVLERRDPSGEWTPALRGSKTLGLLVYLATLDGRAASREQVADLLWGDESPERARGSLRQAVYALRQVLGDDVLLTDRETIGLTVGVIDSDRDHYVAAAREGDLLGMLAVYGGPFCESVSPGEAVEFQRWLDAERVRLDRLLLDLAVTRIPVWIEAGETEQAVRASRRLAEVFPEQSEAAVMLFDALVAGGGRHEAVERLGAHATRLQAHEVTVPPGVAERLSRARRAGVEPSPAAGTGLYSVGQVLIGREPLLAALLREAEQARLQGRRRAVLTGPAGVGKTRALDELEARLRLRGARVVRVAFLPGMHEIEYAAVVEVVRALAGLPGALGIAETSARRLIAVLPELRERFPGVTSDSVRGSEGVRGLVGALRDLLSSVSEERLVVVMLDNMHHADAASQDVLSSAGGDRGSRLLELWTTRPRVEVAFAEATVRMEVLPLAEEDVRALLTAVAPLPEAAWASRFVRVLHAQTRGMPQLLLAAIRTLGAAGLLRVSDGAWATDDPDRLLRHAEETTGTATLLAGLEAPTRRILELLVAWARPLEERDLLGVLAGAEGGPAEEDLRRRLRHLEALGLVQSRDTAWAVAHDTIADEVRNTPADVAAQRPFDLLLAYWGDSHRLTVSVLEHLAMLAGTAASPGDAVRLARVAARSERLRRSGLRGRRLARRVARMSGHEAWASPILRSLGFFARQGDTARTLTAAASVLALLGLVWLADRLQPRVVVDSAPMTDAPPPGQPVEFVVQPRVVVENGFGRRLDLDAPILVRTDYGQLVGDTIVHARNGVAQYRTLALRTELPRTVDQPVHLSFSGPWYLRGAVQPVIGISTGFQLDEFRVVEIAVNGQQLTDSLTLRAGLRDSLRFDVTFEYTTTHATANYVVGAMPTWGPRERSAIRLAGLPRPVQRAWRSVTFAVPPPAQPGPQHIVILFDQEDTVDHLFSNTNWQAGSAIWGDGNDIPDLPFELLETLRTTGRMIVPSHVRVRYETRQADLRLGDEIFQRPVAGAFSGVAIRHGRAILVHFEDELADPIVQ